MDMGASSIAGMAMPAATATAAAASTPTDTMSMGMEGGCQISMLWNWNTIDACFISSTWRITSTGMFAGSCIGVVLLVVCLEFLRRLSKEYDRFIVRQAQRQQLNLYDGSNVTNLGANPLPSTTKGSATASNRETESPNGKHVQASPLFQPPSLVFRPSLIQQALRATLHMTQFTVAYFIMLLAMYYNGYIIISIIIGAWIGAFIFSWGAIPLIVYVLRTPHPMGTRLTKASSQERIKKKQLCG